MGDLIIFRNTKKQRKMEEGDMILEEMIKSAFLSGFALFVGKLAIEMLRGILSSDEVDSFTKEIIRKDLMRGM